MSVIAIDGTFASGKGTLGKRLSAHYGLPYLDTGKLYRAVALGVQMAGGAFDDAGLAGSVAASLDVSTLDDPRLKSGAIGAGASKVSVFPEVRAALLEFQRNFAASPGGAILDGRDIGTVICPNADVKFFVSADPKIRAQRRLDELLSYGEDTDFDTVLAALAERDHRDMSRKDAPLKPAPDSHYLDTTDLSIAEVLARAVAIIEASKTR